MPAEETLVTENTPLLREENVVSNGTIDSEQASGEFPPDDAPQKESRMTLKYIVPAISIGVSSLPALLHFESVANMITTRRSSCLPPTRQSSSQAMARLAAIYMP